MFMNPAERISTGPDRRTQFAQR